MAIKTAGKSCHAMRKRSPLPFATTREEHDGEVSTFALIRLLLHPYTALLDILSIRGTGAFARATAKTALSAEPASACACVHNNVILLFLRRCLPFGVQMSLLKDATEPSVAGRSCFASFSMQKSYSRAVVRKMLGKVGLNAEFDFRVNFLSHSHAKTKAAITSDGQRYRHQTPV